MRIYFHLTRNHELVPFNYQRNLVGAFHKWLGENELHDQLSLYSMSWLSHGEKRGKGLDFQNGSTFSISSPNPEFLAQLLQGVQDGHEIAWGMRVDHLTVQRTPNFGKRKVFFADSPVHLKEWIDDKQEYVSPNDQQADELLTRVLHSKLDRAGISARADVSFDKSYPKKREKMITYKGINIKAWFCPVIVEGDEQAVSFAWDVGAGHSTGIGFGALR